MVWFGLVWFPLNDLNRPASLLFTPPPPARPAPRSCAAPLSLQGCSITLQGDVASPEFPRRDKQGWKQASGELPFAALLFPQQEQRYFLPTPLPTLHFKEQLLFWRRTALYQSARYSAVNYLKRETSPTRCLSWNWSPNPVTEMKGWERRGT